MKTKILAFLMIGFAVSAAAAESEVLKECLAHSDGESIKVTYSHEHDGEVTWPFLFSSMYGHNAISIEVPAALEGTFSTQKYQMTVSFISRAGRLIMGYHALGEPAGMGTVATDYFPEFVSSTTDGWNTSGPIPGDAVHIGFKNNNYVSECVYQ